MTMAKASLLGLCVLISGCFGVEDEPEGEAGQGTDEPGSGESADTMPPGTEGTGESGDPSSESGSDSGSDTTADPGEPGWAVTFHSCPGASRTDALLVEDDAIWVGCGTNATGYGLHTSSDDGTTWNVIETDPEGDMAQFRVSAIARGEDGLLYVAGLDANDAQMVMSLDTSVSPSVATEVLYAGNVVGTSFHVGSMALLSEGRIFVESLTGLGALFRPDSTVGADGGTWTDAYYWANAGSPPGYQMMDLFANGDELYGCGATIAEPPYLFLPPRDAGAEPYEMEVIALPTTGGTGEMWGVAATEDRVVVVGVDQDADVGKIFVSGADPYDATGYAQIDLPDIVGDSNLGTWARGVCMRDDRIVVVGERQPLSSGTGLVLLSDDGGQTFTNITPEEATESMSKCTILANGEVIVAGAGGFFGRYN
jgi:hypothetical protein